MAIANRDSVTVSIAADTSGTLIFSFRVKFVRVSTSAGSTELLPGTSKTSSNVRPSRMAPSIIPTSRIGFQGLFYKPQAQKDSAFTPAYRGRVTALSKKVCALKQRSPAGGRWAVGKIHRIEKMNHCE